MMHVGVLAVRSDGMAAGIQTRKGIRWIERRMFTDSHSPAELADVMLARRELRTARGVLVLLHPALLQFRTLHALPPVRERQLNGIVRGQLKRFFRTNGTEMVVSAVWERSEGNQRVARAVAADLSLIESIESAIARTGSRLLGIRPGRRGRDATLSLMSPRGRALRLRSIARKASLYVAMAVLAWMVAAGIYVGDLLSDRAAVEADLGSLGPSVEQMRKVGQEVAAFRETADLVRGQGPSGAWVVDRLASIAEALPDSCYVLRITLLHGGAIHLTARAENPVAVVDALAKAGLGTPALDSSPTHGPDPESSWYEFSVTMGAAV